MRHSHRSSSRNRSTMGRVAFALLLLSARMYGGTYSQNFNAATVGSSTLGDGSTVASSAGTAAVRIWAQGNKGLQLMAGLGGNTGSWKMPDLDVGKEIQSFDANFIAGTYRSSATSTPGAGWSLNFGAVPSGNGAGEGGFVMPNGIVIAWDIFNNGGSDNPSIEVLCNGASVGDFPSATLTDSPVPDGGTFTLTNPVSGGVTAPIAYNANAAVLQAAMRLVAGWEAVTVSGAAPWIVNHGVVGAYADPVADGATLVPANSTATVTATVIGNATTNHQWKVALRAYRPRVVAIHWDYEGLDLSVNGVNIFTNLPTPGFVPAAGNKFAFSARCESSNTMDLFLDDVALSTSQTTPVETGGPVITEFMADNDKTLEDEDTDSPDWIEIYNGQNATVNLSGYRLTNIQGNNGLWTFPSISLAPYAYKIVYASGKNRKITTGQLHTNFTLQKEAGYLALIKPDGITIASQFSYGAQYKDVSYGEKGPARTLGYLQPPTPGAKAPYSVFQESQGPAEDVVWSREGGIITGATPVSITPPSIVGSVVRYTTNNADPTEGSPIYSTPFNVTAGTRLRARVYTPGHLPGPVTSRTFLLIQSTGTTSLTNYNNSGEVFSSHLPIIVLDSFGVPVDSYTDPDATEGRIFRYTYGVVIDKDPATGRASITSPMVDFQGRGGTHVRGSSSAGFPQKQYSWEAWDNQNRDKNVSMLGMPEDSDWVIYAPYDDKALMRNYLVYSRALALAGSNFGIRTRFCEVFFNQEAGQPVSYADYRGVYVLMEKIKITKDRVDLAKLNSLTTDPAMVTGGYIMKLDRAAVGDSEADGLRSHDPQSWNSAQQSYLQTFLNNTDAALAAINSDSSSTAYQTYIDRDSFIDNQWFVEIMKQIDGYRLSNYMYKDRGGKLFQGPIWDYNLSLSNADYLDGWIPTGWYYPSVGEDDRWYTPLHKNTTGVYPYELRHWDRYWELRRGLFKTSTILGEIDAEAATLLNGSTTPVTNSMPALPPAQENAVRRHYRRWPVLGTYLWPNAPGYAQRIYFNSNGNATTGEVDFMKDWLNQRFNWIDNQNFVGTTIFRPPNFSHNGGNVAAGFQLTVTRYAGTPPVGFTYATGGTLYYTLDDSDPRGSTGLPAGTTYSGPITLNSSKTVKARLNVGANWSPLMEATFIVNAVPASAANLVVSELHYHPSAPTSTESAAGFSSSNDFEYIELLNVSGQNVDLSNCQFTVGVTFNFGNADPNLLTLPPGGRILVVDNAGAFHFRYGNNPAMIIAGEYSGNLDNAGERITLLAANLATIADFTYGTAEPWPVDSDGLGYSLVLNNPAGGVNYAAGSSWRSSAQVGGTPGLANSTTFTGSPAGDTDGDGFKDYLEHATASNWNDPASRNPPVVSFAPFVVMGVTDSYLRLDYRRNLAADGVNYSVQMSENLAGAWSSDASAVTYVSSHNNGDGTATVTYRSTQPAGPGHPQAFMRLQVSP